MYMYRPAFSPRNSLDFATVLVGWSGKVFTTTLNITFLRSFRLMTRSCLAPALCALVFLRLAVFSSSQPRALEVGNLEVFVARS